MTKKNSSQVNFSFEIDSKVLRDALTKIKKFIPPGSTALKKFVDVMQLRVTGLGRVFLDVNQYPRSGGNRISLVLAEPETITGSGIVPLHHSSLTKAIKLGKGLLELRHEGPTTGDSSVAIDFKTKTGSRVSRKIKVQSEFGEIFSEKILADSEFSESALVENNELRRALKHILRSIDLENCISNYTGSVSVMVIDTAASKKGTYKDFPIGLYLVGTDGRRLHYVRLVNSGDAKSKDINLLVNAEGFNALLPILGGEDGVALKTRTAKKEKYCVSFEYAQQAVEDEDGEVVDRAKHPDHKTGVERYAWGLEFDAPGFTASFSAVDTPYPDWIKVLPEGEPTLTLRFNAPDYVEAIKAVSDIAKTRTGRDAIGLHVEQLPDGKYLVIQAKEPETGDEASSRIPVEIIQGEPYRIFSCVSFKYAQQAVEDEDGEVTVKFYGEGHLNPLVYTGTFDRHSIVMSVNNISKSDDPLFEIPKKIVKYRNENPIAEKKA